MKYIPFHCHTSFSLLDGIVKPNKFAKRCEELNYSYAMITDHGNVSGAIKFAKEMEKKNILPILGTEFYIPYHDSHIKNDTNRKTFHMVVCAKNRESWHKLMKAVSISNNPDNFYYKPRLSLERLSEIIGNSCFIFSGHPGSYLWDFKALDELTNGINYLKSLFGENLFLESQKFIQDEDVDEHIRVLEDASKKTGTKIVACEDIHYTLKSDSKLHRVVLCSNLNKTLPQIENLPNKDKPMSAFFLKECFYLHSLEEMKNFGHTESELNFSDITSQIDHFDLQTKPRLPKYSNDEKKTIKKECKEGWIQKNKKWGKEYKERAKQELEIINEYNLSGYFLIVSDYIKWAKSKGMLLGPARGSSAGSLICYLMSITEIDPIKYKLDFERFINKDRIGTMAMSFEELSYEEFEKSLNE